MRCVSFLLCIPRAGRGEQDAFASRRRLAADRSLTLSMRFWAEDTRAHRVEVFDEPPEGSARVIGSRTAEASRDGALLSIDLPLSPLGTAGLHRLHLDVDGERVLSLPVGVTVRNVIPRGQRARYKGRGTLSPMPLARPDGRGEGYLYHGELFPIERPARENGTVSGLWIAAYFRGFPVAGAGPHLFKVTDRMPGGTERVLAVHYGDVGGPGLLMRFRLDPVGPPGPHTLSLSIDDRHAGELSVTI